MSEHSGEFAPLLTDDEHEAMRLTAQLANLLGKIIGQGDQAQHDWAEAAHRINSIQHTILAQAAARAYPDLYRPLGGWPHTTTIRSDALVGIPISALSDISFLLGMLEHLMKPSGAAPRVLEEVREALMEAIERGEVVPLSDRQGPSDG